MRASKILNNNVVLTQSVDGDEIIVTGTGIGFHLSPGDTIDDKKISKVYTMENERTASSFIKVMRETPEIHFEIAEEIIEYARNEMGMKLSNYIFVTLIDHINFAISRYKETIFINNCLSWEIKKFYPREYSVGKKAVDLINQKLDIFLPDDEAANIAFHFVNAQLSQDSISSVYQIVRFIKDIVRIIEIHFGIIMDEESISYARTVTHLQFLGQRVIHKKVLENPDQELYGHLKAIYVNENECAIRIKNYVQNTYNVTLNEAEMAYLIVHIRRIIVEHQHEEE